MQKHIKLLKIVSVSLLALTSVACQPVYVQDSRDYRDQGWSMEWGGGIRARVDRARIHIEQGAQRGGLTPPEVTRLRLKLDVILQKIDSMQRDGRISYQERERIDHDLDKLERDIYKENYDKDYRRR